jgi:hypothetical protein
MGMAVRYFDDFAVPFNIRSPAFHIPNTSHPSISISTTTPSTAQAAAKSECTPSGKNAVAKKNPGASK